MTVTIKQETKGDNREGNVSHNHTAQEENAMTTYTINNELNGIEIRFAEKPGDIIREELKKSGFRWHKVKKVWYAKQTPERLALAEKLANPPAACVIARESEAKEQAAAWTAERMSKIVAGYTFEATGEGLYAGWTGNNNARKLYGQDLKKAILAELKKNGIKATARSSRGGYTESFTFTVYVPAELIETPEMLADRLMDRIGYTSWIYREDGSSYYHEDLPTEYEARKAALLEHAKYIYRNRVEPIEEFEQVVKTIVSSFNSDHSNSMVDYFDKGFYEHYEWEAE